MNKLIYILILSVFFTACTSNTIIKKPDNLIPKEQMVNLLTDILLAEGGDNIKNLNLQRNVNYFPLVFEKHKIDTVRFKESSFYYTSKIDDYTEIFEQVDKRLKTLKESYAAEIKLADSLSRQRRDSVRNSKKPLSKKQKKGDSIIDLPLRDLKGEIIK